MKFSAPISTMGGYQILSFVLDWSNALVSLASGIYTNNVRLSTFLLAKMLAGQASGLKSYV